MSLDPATLETTHFRWAFADGVGTITLDRPERKNPLTFDSYAELRDLFRALASTPEVRVVVLDGAGGNFCAGGDLKGMEGRAPVAGSGAAESVAASNRRFGALLEMVDALPKAVIVVDLYGQCASYEPIVAACREHGVYLIEDAAEALGATYQGRPAGTFDDLAVFSFNGNKIITTSGGGMLVAHRKEWIERARYLATQARSPARHYEHEAIGYNYRLSNL